MPRRGTAAQRLVWHLAHREHCGCRPIPAGSAAMATAGPPALRSVRSLRAMLLGGDRRSIAGSNGVLAMLRVHPERVAGVAALAEDSDWLVSLRALDVLENLVHEHADWVDPYRHLFIGPLADSETWEVRLQVVRALPYLHWTRQERSGFSPSCAGTSRIPGAFVAAWALDGLARFALDDARLLSEVRRYLSVFEGSGRTALAVRARHIRRRGLAEAVKGGAMRADLSVGRPKGTPRGGVLVLHAFWGRTVSVLSCMRTRTLVFAGVFVLPTLALAQLTTGTTDVTLRDQTVVRVESGQLQVPESRLRPTRRRLMISFYRLASDAAAAAAPIFLLAGGPGGSWLQQFEAAETNREARFYQTIADVVLFDQRGSGRASPALTCGDSAPLPPPDLPLDMTTVAGTLRRLLVQCRDRWQAQGVDLAAYNTVESAADVNDLRLALGYPKITLIGGSYGSHLALQFMRQFPDAVERVVIFGVEGPDHTWDDPADALHTLERIAAATEHSPEFRSRIPEGGLLTALERALARLDAEPQMVTVTTGAATTRVLVNGCSPPAPRRHQPRVRSGVRRVAIR